MSLRSPKPRSIAAQLVFRFTLAAALLLFCGLVVLYLIVVRHAFEEDNVFLADKIFALRADLKKANGPQPLREQLTARRGDKSITYWIRITNSAGETVMETPGMKDLLPISVFPLAENETASRKPKDYRIRKKLFSLATTSEKGNSQRYVMQVAQDRSADDQFSRQFGALLAVVLVFGTLISAVIAGTVTKRGLRPLAEMTRSFQRVGPTHLHERTPPTAWPHELQPLAAAFDDMLDRLEISFTRLSQFSADIAHEIRTPVANIRGEAEVALTRDRTPAEYREVMESNVAECERLSGIVDNLLFLARAEAADRQVQSKTFDGRAEIEKIAAFYEMIAEDQRITLTCAGNGKIDADPLLFARAVSNLVENALRFTPAEGKIRISIEDRPAQSKIEVSDTGRGISKEHIARVFDRFYRIDPSRSSAGAGLGLALVKSITDMHGGSATIESEINRGTKVTLTFPHPACEDAR